MEINKKSLKKVLEEQREDYQRYLGVLAEDFGSQVKLVAEQYDDIKINISDIKQTLNSHTEMIGSMKINIEVMKMDIATTKTDVEIIKTGIEFIKGGIKKKVDYDEFAFLEKRVMTLEKSKKI